MDSFTKYWISTLRGTGSDPSQVTWALNFWEVSSITMQVCECSEKIHISFFPFAGIFHMRFYFYFFFLSIFSFLFIFQWVLGNPYMNWVCILSFLIEILQYLWNIIVDPEVSQGLQRHSRYLKARDCYWGTNDDIFSGSKCHCNLMLKISLDLQ